MNNSKDKFLKIYTEKLKYFNYSVHTIREWTCKNGHVLDCDLNAAKNILKEA